MSSARTSQPPFPMPRAEPTPTSTISHLMSMPGLWLWRLRCRRQLSTLTPEQMRDTGLDPEMVRRESLKPFWEA